MLRLTTQSSLQKIFCNDKEYSAPYLRGSGLRGEEFSFQLVLNKEGNNAARGVLTLESRLKEHISLFRVGNVPCEFPAYPDRNDGDYITLEPGLFPDLLSPMEEGGIVIMPHVNNVFWVSVKIPEDCAAGEYSISFTADMNGEEVRAEFTLKVIAAGLPEQKLWYTQWFYADCIADRYKTPVYSEEHWQLLEKYMKMASEHGVNMIFTPIFSPALDTEIGGERPCTQLLDIKKSGDTYTFGYDKVKRYMELAESCGIKCFEISHLFSQWGAMYAPNIYAETDGGYKRIFGWDVKSDSPEYREFLKQFLPDFTGYLKENGYASRVMFHISDEPSANGLEQYKKAKEGAAPYLKDFPVRDALSDYVFYESGVVELPIPATDHIEPFLENNVPDLWTYNCCGQTVDVGNRFLAMPSYRNRILGQQMWKYGITGFLHWGFNFWYLQESRGMIDPYRVTDAGGVYPGGDSFSVYPGEDGPLPSIRLKVFNEGLQDLRALELLESLIGKEETSKLIEDYDGLSFSNYPRSADSLLNTRERINERIAQALKQKG